MIIEGDRRPDNGSIHNQKIPFDTPKIGDPHGEVSGRIGFTELQQLYQAPKESREVKSPTGKEWMFVVEGYTPEDSIEEERRERLLALGNGNFTIEQKGIDGSIHMVYQKGFYMRNSESESSDSSPVAAAFNIAGFGLHINNGEHLNPRTSDLSDIKREYDLRHATLTTSYTWHEHDKGQERKTDVEIELFVSQTDPNIIARKITLKPNYNGSLTVKMGIEGNADNGGIDFVEEAQTEEVDAKITHYSAKARSHTEVSKPKDIAIAHKIDTNSDDIQRKILHENRSIHQDITVAEAKAGQPLVFEEIISLHTSVDQKYGDKFGCTPGEAAIAEIKEVKNYDELKKAHIKAWDTIWEDSELEVEGDPEVVFAHHFNRSHSLQDEREGYDEGSTGAKFNPKPRKGYGRRSFHDDRYRAHKKPELLETHLNFRMKLMEAARKKAKRTLYDFRMRTATTDEERAKAETLYHSNIDEGIHLPWEAYSPPEDGEDPEGGPKWIINAKGEKVEVEALEEEIHINAAFVRQIVELYHMTGDKEKLRKFAPFILESARFYSLRGSEDGVYRGVMGTNEYHPHVDNNGLTQTYSKYTIDKALWLLQEGIVTDEQIKELHLTQEELDKWEDMRQKIHIPLNTKTMILSAFDGYEEKQHIDLNSPEYKGVVGMDSFLLKKGIHVRDTDVIKQPDATLVLRELYYDFLNLLSPEQLKELRLNNPGKSDNEIMALIFKTNQKYYREHTCHGSSLSPNENVIADLLAGEDPNTVFETYKETIAMDVSHKNTHNTQDGLHSGNINAAEKALDEGYGGVTINKDGIHMIPRLPDASKISVIRSTEYYNGNKVGIEVNQNTNKITATALEFAQGEEGSVPVYLNGNFISLSREHRTESVALKDTAQEQQEKTIFSSTPKLPQFSLPQQPIFNGQTYAQ